MSLGNSCLLNTHVEVRGEYIRDQDPFYPGIAGVKLMPSDLVAGDCSHKATSLALFWIIC